jgi:hypothetical protein
MYCILACMPTLLLTCYALCTITHYLYTLCTHAGRRQPGRVHYRPAAGRRQRGSEHLYSSCQWCHLQRLCGHLPQAQGRAEVDQHQQRRATGADHCTPYPPRQEGWQEALPLDRSSVTVTQRNRARCATGFALLHISPAVHEALHEGYSNSRDCSSLLEQYLSTPWHEQSPKS